MPHASCHCAEGNTRLLITIHFFVSSFAYNNENDGSDDDGESYLSLGTYWVPSIVLYILHVI